MSPMLAVFAPGPVEIGIVLIVAILIFGHRLPKLARSAGQSIVEFRRGAKEIQSACLDLDQEIKNKEAETSRS